MQGNNSGPAITHHHQPPTATTANHGTNACAYSSSKDDQLIAQLEYYFSQDNLIQDHYLRSQMDDEDYVPILTLCNFQKVRKYIDEVSDPEQYIATLVQTKSDVLQVDDLGLKVKAQSGPIKFRLVVRDVPPNYTRDEVMDMFRINDTCKVLSAEPTGCNSTWYVGYELESDVQDAMDHLRNTRPNLKFHMKKISAGHYQGPSSRPAVSKPISWSNGVYSPPSPMSTPSAPVSTWSPVAYNPATYTNAPILQPASTSRPSEHYSYEYQPAMQKSWSASNSKLNQRGRNYPKQSSPLHSPIFLRTMYQPFNRRGIENGPLCPPEHKTRTNVPKAPRQRPNPRPNEELPKMQRPDTRTRKIHQKVQESTDRPSPPLSDKESIPSPSVINFTLFPDDFPGLGNVKTERLSTPDLNNNTIGQSSNVIGENIKKNLDAEEAKIIINKIADVVRNPGPPSLSCDPQKRLGSGRSDNRKTKTPTRNKPNGDSVRTEGRSGDTRHFNVKQSTPDRLDDESEVPTPQAAPAWPKGRTLAEAVRRGPKVFTESVKPQSQSAISGAATHSSDKLDNGPISKVTELPSKPIRKSIDVELIRKPERPAVERKPERLPTPEPAQPNDKENEEDPELDGWSTVEKPKKNKKSERKEYQTGQEEGRPEQLRNYNRERHPRRDGAMRDDRRDRRHERPEHDKGDRSKRYVNDRPKRTNRNDRPSRISFKEEKLPEMKEDRVPEASIPLPDPTSDAFGPSLVPGSPVVSLSVAANPFVTCRWADIASK